MNYLMGLAWGFGGLIHYLSLWREAWQHGTEEVVEFYTGSGGSWEREPLGLTWTLGNLIVHFQEHTSSNRAIPPNHSKKWCSLVTKHSNL